MKKYKATFPLKYGDLATRIYDKQSTAIAQAKKHLAECQAPTHLRAEVWEIDAENSMKTVRIWEAEL